MNGFVVVRLLGGAADAVAPPPSYRRLQDADPVLRLSMGPTPDGDDVVAEAGPVRRGRGPDRDVPGPATDEHFTADAEACFGRRLACADVLYARRPRSLAAAVRWLAEVRARQPACGLAAAPVADGGWLAVSGSTRGATSTVLAAAVPPDQPLLASCLHAWVVCGYSLAELEHVRPAGGGVMAAVPLAPGGGRPRGW
ncbi:hypothetical protein AQI95_24490 [Streptomyces yokosukanensis]|uniref:Uncharacterized protein n=1 Tax=Streptomyces yokosukanensis TaxID=67386 RepID=A0A101P1C8_9ACTN|nr:hypothetical protein [Streptomyces yokosukanensis]KUN03122.1 hypothetical protein AQI95_24490 [Streptomyces yokosukanensis]